MRRIFTLFLGVFSLIILTCACCKTIFQHPLSGPEEAKLTGDYTIALMYNKTTPKGKIFSPICSGVWIAKDVILTANHCVEGIVDHLNEENGADDENSIFPKVKPETVTIQYIVKDEVIDVGKNPAGVHNSVVVAYNKKMDLALLKTSGSLESIPKHRIARLADRTPPVGEHLSFVGHVRGMYWTFFGGNVAAYRNDVGDDDLDIKGPFLQVSAPVYFGNSGGGCFNDYGELVGIASFINSSPNTGFYVYLETIRGFLAANGLVKLKLNPAAPDPEF